MRNSPTKKLETESNQPLTNSQKIIQTVENSVENMTQFYRKKQMVRKKGGEGNPETKKYLREQLPNELHAHYLIHDSNNLTIFKTKT